VGARAPFPSALDLRRTFPCPLCAAWTDGGVGSFTRGPQSVLNLNETNLGLVLSTLLPSRSRLHGFASGLVIQVNARTRKARYGG
jgi:hypothetical protein